MPVESTDTLTDAQQERRLRVIDAAMDLAASGGYDAVQMRAVSERADVALGTIYRYFSSKDHLLVAGMVEWMVELERLVERRPPVGDSEAERVADVLSRALNTMQHAPEQTAAVVRAQTSDDGAAVRATQEVTAIMERLMEAAIAEDSDHERARNVIRVLGHVWFSALVSWTAGVGDMAWVRAEVETATQLLLGRST